MKCPNCQQTLLITERLNVEIDYCPSCRGVWLDKGELDKIIDISNQELSGASKKHYEEDDDKSHESLGAGKSKSDKYIDSRYYFNKSNKKKSFLGDLFNFG